jgi:prolyl 4-hydroxylase
MNAGPREELEALAWRGDAAAQFAYAQALEADGEDDKAGRWLKRAAGAGSTAAKAALGARCLTRQPFALEDGVALTREAAAEGDAGATYLLAVLAGSGLGVPQDWDAALDHLVRAAQLGSRPAREDLILLAGADAEAAPAPPHWRELRARIDLAQLLAVPQPRAVLASPRAFVVEAFAAPEICARVIARGAPLLAPAQVIDAASGGLRYGSGRSNSAAFFNLAEMDFTLVLLRARIAAVTGLGVPGMEAANLFHYALGQEFAPHFDFLDADYPGYARQLADSGAQRVLTFLIYLNEDYDGGETDFPHGPWRHKGRTGDAMFFWNVEPSGMPDRRSWHAGLPPTRGEKYLLSQWIQGRIAPAG